MLTLEDVGGARRKVVTDHGLRLAYLSGSPRIATRADAEVSGPRAHILGMIDALRSQGHHVDEFVLGDRMRPSVSGTGSRGLVSGGAIRQVAVDLARVGLRLPTARRATRALPGPYDAVYERFALFQELGRPFQRRGAAWVLETNAVVSDEARHERDALALQRLAYRLERATYGRADLVVAISDALRDLLVQRMDVPVDRVVVVPNAVDVSRFRPSGRGAGEVTGSGDLVVGFVGFVIERQGLDELVHAVRLLRDRGVAIRAVVVGEGPDRERLEALVAHTGLAKSVRFVGQVPWDEVPRWIDSFSLGYSGQRGVGGMPMYHSPLKIYEYLAMARPVVASDHPDARKTLVQPAAGWTFEAGDVDALADRLAGVARLSAEELTAHGRRGRSHVEEHHTWGARSRQLTRELVARRLIGPERLRTGTPPTGLG